MQELIESVGKLSAKQRKALAVLLKQKGVNLFTIAPVFQRAADEPLLLSYAQQRQWFLWQWAPQSTAYNIPTALRLKGRLDVAALQRSFEALIKRHESLRSVFAQQDDQPVQVVLPPRSFALVVDELDRPAGEPLEAHLQAFVEEETGKTFDLHDGPLMRARLLRLAADDHVLVVTLHHIVSDAWSMQIMVEELVQFYASFSQGRDVQLPELTIQYADYAQWQRQWMEAGEQERQLAYWQDKLGGEQPVLELPTDFSRPAVQSFAGASRSIILDEALADALKALAKRENTTLFVLLLASFQTLLHRYSGQDDIRVGVPIANRGRAEIERLIGFFVNTQVLKADIDGQLPFVELLRQVRQTAQDAQAHQDLPFEQLVEALQPGRSLSHSPLFQVMFNHQTQSRGSAETRFAELEVERLEWQSQTAQFDLVLNTTEHPHGIEAVLKYATDLFEASTIERLAGHWQNLLRAIVADPMQRVVELPMLANVDQQQILVEWNRSKASYPDDQAIHRLIERQCVATPDAPALAFGSQQLSYIELNRRANQWAHRLIELGVGPDVLVGIAVDRSLEMVIGLLAVLKAGGAYVPLDPEYPQDRLSYMIEDSGLKLLLTQEHVLARLPIPADVQSLDLNQTPGSYSDSNPQVALDPENLAYAIYTSGSTGKPKGVMVRHGALTNFIVSMASAPGIAAQDRLLSLTTFSFDIFGLELYAPLMVGGRVVMADKDTQRDPELILKQVQEQGITVLQATPSTWRMLLESPNAGLLQGRRFFCGGEALADELAARMIGLGAETWNLYGPTETTIWSALQPLSLEKAHPYLGKPINNTSLYILGEDLSANPVGVAGELLIGGDGLARGYFQRPALTAERFLPNPYGEPGGRFYRTGDLARYRADGVIDYISRIDHQVKIRGFRIELGEIEARLLEHRSVREAVVIAQDSAQGPTLVGYIVTGVTDEDALRESLKHTLHQQLPEYMVPQHWLFLERLPLTPNGKLDRKALPQVDASRVQKIYVAPTTVLQQQVAQIWQDVLKLEQVGLTDNFFELGGHSLLATQVVSRVRQLLNAEVALRTLFEHSTLQAFVQTLDSNQQQPQQLPALCRVERGQPLPLSYAQERQWFLWQLDPLSSAYHIPTALRLRGALDIAALQSSFNALLARHESLRTQFIDDNGRTLQVIQPRLELALAVEPFGPAADGQAFDLQLKARVDEEIGQLFDLRQGPLLRVKLLQLANDDHVLVLTQHHIVSDRWSMQVTVKELIELYAGHSQGQEVHLPALPVQYADYAVWQRQWMDDGERERQLAYWLEQLGDEQPVLELPTDHPRPAQQSYRGAQLPIRLSPALGAALQHVAQREQVTLFMLLLASFQALLHRYSGQDDIRVGVPIANRNRIETERLIGFFVNTQVLRARFVDGMSFRDLLGQVRQAALAGQTWQDLPFEQLVDRLQPERSLSHNPLFQVMFNHQSHDPQKSDISAQPGQLQVEGLSWESNTAQFDLTLNTFESEDGVSASLIYATDLFEAATVERLAMHWQTLLQDLVLDPSQHIVDMTLLTDDDEQEALELWNATSVAYPSVQPIHRLIERQEQLAPQAPAVVFAGQTLSYAQLNAMANQWANRLRAAGVGPDVIVGIAVERSFEMVIGLLAIMKAGGAYLPLDPEYPQERLAYMFEDSGIELLLTQQHLLESLPIAANIQTFCLDKLPLGYSDRNADVEIDAENLAYVIYTSGSTGKPKGSGNRHLALHNRLAWMQQAYGLDPQESVLQKTPFSFDVSVWEFFWPLMVGARLVVAGVGEHRDPAQLAALIERYRISTLHFVPSMLQAFVGDERVSDCRSLRRIICSGEALPVELQRKVMSQFPGAELYNLYGPTEAAIDVTHWTCVEERVDTVPIGRPISNLQAYVLDGELRPVPVGVIGELYLGGTGLGRGYHRRPALTAERFVVDPFNDGKRLYRTGDLTRYRADGVIEYIGRIDHQVKVRGLRIELGEIEARLMALDSVREGVVLAVEGPGGQQLVAYAVPSAPDLDADAQAQLIDGIRAQLKTQLPDYMVPSQWVLLENLPLTPNGKLDRKALPAPDVSQAQRHHVAPRSTTEATLAAIWQDILKIERVGVTDNFFSLGGDSIISIQVVSRARQAGIHFTPKDLFQQQTIQGLASVARQSVTVAETDQGHVQGVTALLPIQHWFLEQSLSNRHHWNQSVLLRTSSPLNADAVEKAVSALWLHHDALRLGFSEEGGEWLATFAGVGPSAAEANLVWHRSVTDIEDMARVADHAQRSFSLQDGPLLRVVLFTLADGAQRLLIVAHHLVVDGVSWRILLEDLQTAYRQALVGQVPSLIAKTSSFKTWAERIQTHARSDALLTQLPYWQMQLADEGAMLPCDNPQGSLDSRYGRTVYSRLSRDLTRRLLQDTPTAYRTQINDLLLTALARVISRWSGHDSTFIQLEGHGREALFDDLDLTRTVGWFTSMFPLRLMAAAEFADSIKQIKEQLRAIPDRGIGFGMLRYLEPSCRSLLSGLAMPRITFNYLGQFDSSFEGQDAELFVPADEPRGSEQGDDGLLGNWLTVNGQVYGGELSVGWSFSEQMFSVQTMEHLAADYARELELLIEHCGSGVQLGVTPSDFPLAALDQQQLDTLPAAPSMIEDIYPLSPMQEGMLFHTLSDDGSNLYVNQISLPVKGLDAERFRRAWEAVVQRQAILRTSFHWHNGLARPLQIVQQQALLDMQVVDWRDRDVSADMIASRAGQECARGFDLTCAPLQRLLLLRTGDEQYQMIWTSHHILMDGWSSSRLFGEVLQHYATGQITGENGRYRDFIAWLQAQDQDAQEQFWRARLSAVNEPTALSQAIHPRHSNDMAGHQAIYSRWDAQQTRRILQFCRDLRVTPSTLIQGAWLLLLQRYTGQTTVTFGATVSGRPEHLSNVGNMLGLFINTLPIIQTLKAEQPLLDWLHQLQAYNLDIRDYSQAPLADVQRWSGLGGQALFDSIIVFENYPIDDRLQDDVETGLDFGKSKNHDVTNVPMDLAVSLGDELSIEYLFLRNSFSLESVEGIRQTLENTLEAMLLAPNECLGNLQRLSAPQRQVFADWSGQPASTHSPLLLPALISRHARTRPDAVALQCAGKSLTYAELEQRANRLAHCLIERGAGPEVVIGVALERSLEIIVSFLAVLKSGAAYVPLDIDYPPERLAYMIEDSGMALLLTHSQLRERLPIAAELQRLELDLVDTSRFADAAPVCRVQPEGLAYLIYTSGSTGRPKGVAVSHGSMSMHCQAIAELYEMDADSCELHFMSFAFDGAHERWLSTLYSGGRLVIREGCLWTPEQTCQALHGYGVTIACFPPAYLKQLAEYVAQSGIAPPPVRIYCFGGDAVPEQTFEQVKAALRPEYLTNGYGPTETVVTPMLWKVPVNQQCEAAYAPIGRAVGQRSLYVLDEDLNPLPPGFAGELYIGGYGVARGYHRRPELTCERFVPDPFGESGARLYRTGDLVRLRADGVLDYVGRIDHQVKVRGFRIELGEVEASLRALVPVTDALVVAREHLSGKQLIGYVVTQDHGLTGDDLKADLRLTLPEYMVPAQIVCLDRFPVTPNGKLDRKALPEPEFKSEDYVAPRTERERQLAEIWAQVLQVGQVGVTDNFFELGGDSILSLQVISRVRNHPTLRMDLKLRDLMRYQTIAGIVEQQLVQTDALPREQDLTGLAEQGLFSLIPIQEWFFAQDMPEKHHYNQALMLSARQALDLDALERALGCLMQHHDALRLRFCQEGGRWMQYYATPQSGEGVLWRRQAEDSQQVLALADETQRSLKLDDGPVWRTVHIAMPEGEARILMVIHHLVVDTVSWRILLDDLKVAYQACLLGEEPKLPIRSSSYRAWAEGLKAQAPGIVEQELEYWMAQLDQPSVDLPCDNRRGKNQVLQQAVARLELSSTQTTQLLKQAPAVYGTQINDLLLSALGRVLCRWSGQASVLVQLEGHGREDLLEQLDLSRTMGWFTSMFPVRLTPQADHDFGASIKAVREQLAAVPQKGIGYGILRHLAGPRLSEQLAALPQASVTFNYLGQFDQSFDENALLLPAPESVGDCYNLQTPLGNSLEIVGQVYDGRLALRCIYSTQRYRTRTMESFIQEYQRELEALVEHCMAQLG